MPPVVSGRSAIRCLCPPSAVPLTWSHGGQLVSSRALTSAVAPGVVRSHPATDPETQSLRSRRMLMPFCCWRLRFALTVPVWSRLSRKQAQESVEVSAASRLRNEVLGLCGSEAYGLSTLGA